jgi:hypothetical protein
VTDQRIVTGVVPGADGQLAHALQHVGWIDLTESQRESESLIEPPDDGRGHARVAAQFEEIVIGLNRIEPQCLRPDRLDDTQHHREYRKSGCFHAETPGTRCFLAVIVVPGTEVPY